MMNIYINGIKNAFRSKEYWFGFAIIIISCLLTAIYNLAPTGIFSDYKIGCSEFFIAATMYSNTLLQISAPVIAIFVCINHNSIFMEDKESIRNAWRRKEMKPHILSAMTIGGSVFLFSFLILLLLGVIIFHLSTGSMEPNFGLFKKLYQSVPIFYILAYILHSCVCGALFALFGISLKILFIEPVNLVLFIPLMYYSCFNRIGILFPISGLIFYIFPLFTFDIALYNVPLLKRIVELSVIIAISIILIVISYRKYYMETRVSASGDKKIKKNFSKLLFKSNDDKVQDKIVK